MYKYVSYSYLNYQMACNMNVIIFVTLRGDLFTLKRKEPINY